MRQENPQTRRKIQRNKAEKAAMTGLRLRAGLRLAAGFFFAGFLAAGFEAALAPVFLAVVFLAVVFFAAP
jgi:hypothetical protein